MLRRLESKTVAGSVPGSAEVTGILADRLIRVCWTGAGPVNAVRAAERLFARTDALDAAVPALFCGFAGGLGADQVSGTLVIVRSVAVCGVPQHRTEPRQANARLLAVAENVRLPGVSIRTGRLATTARVLVEPTEKHELAAECGADAVDMETVWVADAAARIGVPWIAVRAITDGPTDRLPLDFNALADSEGNVAQNMVLRKALLHPRSIPGLIRLGLRAARGGNLLADFIEAYLPGLPDE